MPARTNRRGNSLTEGDLETLALRIKLAVLEGFDAHREADHKPLDVKLNNLNLKMVGIGAAAGAAVLGAKSVLAKMLGL